MSPRGQDTLAFTTAAIVGLAAWCGVAWATGHREAWDSIRYAQISLPLLVVTAGVLGVFVPRKPWRWGATLGAAQIAALFALHPETGPLTGLGVLMLGLLALGLAAVAEACAARARRAW